LPLNPKEDKRHRQIWQRDILKDCADLLVIKPFLSIVEAKKANQDKERLKIK
jgi:hypothetical protein